MATCSPTGGARSNLVHRPMPCDMWPPITTAPAIDNTNASTNTGASTKMTDRVFAALAALEAATAVIVCHPDDEAIIKTAAEASPYLIEVQTSRHVQPGRMILMPKSPGFL